MIKLHIKLLFWHHGFTDKEQSWERTLCIFHKILSDKIDKFLFPIGLQADMM